MPLYIERPGGGTAVFPDDYRERLEGNGYVLHSDGTFRQGAEVIPETPETPEPFVPQEYEGIPQQMFEDDFRGFLISLKSKNGGAYVNDNGGEEHFRSIWESGQAHFGLTTSIPDAVGDDTGTLSETDRILELEQQLERERKQREAEAKAADQRSARAIIEETLGSYGLGSLSGDIWKWIKDGQGVAEVMQNIRKTSDYAERFPAMEMRRQAGMAPISADQYIALEKSYGEVLNYWEMPAGFYDAKNDFTELIGSDRSPELLSRLLSEGYNRVANTAPEVRSAFANYFGVRGDTALAAMYLDPERGTQTLINMARTAVAGGIAKQQDISLGQDLASQISAFNPSEASLRSGFSQVNSLRPVTRETVSETRDISIQDAAAAQFGLDNSAREKIQRRVSSRQSAFRGGGGAASTGQGFIGLGSES